MNKEELEEKRFEELCERVEKIYALLVGNGREGIIGRVARTEDRLKYITWIVSIIVAAALGTGAGVGYKQFLMDGPEEPNITIPMK